MTPVKQRPILFTADMIRALLAGQKTQTRRIIRTQPHPGCTYCYDGMGMSEDDADWHYLERLDSLTGGYTEDYYTLAKCPYGLAGDELYVKETWAQTPGLVTSDKNGTYHYRADHDYRTDSDYNWKSPLFMPKNVARLYLSLTDVAAERLQTISAADAIAEGIEPVAGEPGGPPVYRLYQKKQRGIDESTPDPVESYRSLWESINGAGSWNNNPWVWVLTVAVKPPAT